MLQCVLQLGELERTVATGTKRSHNIHRCKVVHAIMRARTEARTVEYGAYTAGGGVYRLERLHAMPCNKGSLFGR